MSVAYVFPGQGAQRVGMGVELAAFSAAAAETFDRASAVLGFDLLELCRRGPEATLRRTEITQPSLLTASIACLAAAGCDLPAPDFVAGVSLGEYSAMVAVGALTLEDAVSVVRTRGELMEQATRGRDVAMAAILGVDEEVVGQLCRSASYAGVCETAVFHAAGHVVVSGDRAAVSLVTGAAAAAGGEAVDLEVSSAFHTSLMAPLVPRLAAVLDGIAMERPQVPVIANVTARSVEEPAALRKILLEQLDHPVRWSETVSHLLDLGVDTFLHFGPGKVVIRTAGRELIRTRSIRDVQTLRAAELFLDPMGGPCRAGSEARAGRR